MYKEWKYKEVPLKADVQRLSKVLNTTASISSLLLQRGIGDFETAKSFFNPTLAQLHDPMSMKGMATAVTHLEKAIAKGAHICVYGDYDVDGTTSVAVLYSALKSLGACVSYYLPDRYKEGYGLSEAGVDHCIAQGVELLVTVDCGTKAVGPIGRLQKAGIATIVCDHHQLGAELPAAVAMVNPQQVDCLYPFKGLSGCGIVFKLLQAYAQKKGGSAAEFNSYLDLVAISIAADIVPMVGENRVLAYHGLRKLNEAPRAGIAALQGNSGFDGKYEIVDIVFKLAPRINAPGRISHAKKAVELLLASSIQEAMPLARIVDEENTTRKTLDSELLAEALALMKADCTFAEQKSTVLFDPKWTKGIVGIGAARCIEHYYRPTILLTQEGDMAIGSARSVVGYNIYKAIDACGDLLTRYGGHAYAAGLAMPLDNLPAFKARFEKIVEATLSDEQARRVQWIDLVLALEEITPAFYEIIKRMGPFGPKHRRPVFATAPVELVSYKIYQGKHIALQVRTPKSRQFFRAIGFNMSHLSDAFSVGKFFAIAYTIQENTFQGYTRYELLLKDIQAFKAQQA
ncbi:MAG: single-stranded-DNA-specific exonuclease RecJ [Bacteroidota bacterium]